MQTYKFYQEKIEETIKEIKRKDSEEKGKLKSQLKSMRDKFESSEQFHKSKSEQAEIQISYLQSEL